MGSGHHARKRFGQHFLADEAIIHAMVREIDPRPGQAMVEIGPGLAALTQPLLDALGRLTVVEIDRDLAARLRRQAGLYVVESDVLRVDFATLAQDAHAHASAAAPDSSIQPSPTSDSRQSADTPSHKLRIVGNLPYNISTPLLFHLLQFVDAVQDQHFMLQKEVIDRMVALPATSDYGRLSVVLQWRYAMENILFVPPESFDPPPKVDSAVVRMVPRTTFEAIDRPHLEALVQVAFSQRRKLLRHTLGAWLDARGFAGTFDVQRRAEEVPVSEYVALAQATQKGLA
ncbi:16S rRNA (adenine(1518)-N(6)/adenine(1519)-N(6))-dimethyltransferase [Comamonas serinivorans]|uniref:Ribosomal RNA small subunit methyltransferase A n=1 Tax=Comamonas serinivorans TaxID=1082851 RepID=A0A1Y0EJY9_9BURK|nr:16S rRNA (adenine(1518)-N(6)/adenine(1519)-N(6))-dimethyltransferase RsmA [Comamonas serinivorans]ARU03679.1 16S rRNA (adenine(1518)-N(6)/adenine(1519)-N(6))-dimethyltransferase [Comamonas serinivorans]